MAKASFMRTSFLGGEWSDFMQGRADLDDYRTALKRNYNAITVEEGAWVRRPGIRFYAHTRGGADASVREFHFAQNDSYVMELTAGHLRFFSNGTLVADIEKTVSSISSATPGVVTTTATHGFTTGDQVYFSLSNLGNGAGTSPLLHRQFTVTVLSTTTFSMVDALTGSSFVGSSVSVSSGDVHVHRIMEQTTAFTGTSYNYVRVIQGEFYTTLLAPGIAPQYLTNEGETFSALAAVDFVDGPYLDPVGETINAGEGTLTPSGTTGSITLTASVAHGIPSTDVGRLVRLLNEPAEWAVATAYSAGDRVKYGGAYWYANASTTGDYPGIDPTIWIVDTNGAFWTWAKVTAYTSSTVVTVTIMGNDLPDTNAISTWRLGLYSVSQGYPTCGCYHGGRLWLSGASANRIDGSVSNNFFSFAPTGEDGTVADNYAVAASFSSKSVNQVQWLASFDKVLLAGTAECEWVVMASNFNDPITPTSIQANPGTFYGSSGGVDVIQAPNSLVYVDRAPSKLVEYVSTGETGKFAGSNLSLKAKHLTRSGIDEMAYQQEPAPIIWAKDTSGDLVGITYKRENPFASQEPTFAAFHWHRPGNGRGFSSLCVGPTPDGAADTLTFCSVNSISDPDYPIYFVEALSEIPNETILINESAYLDSFIVPSTADWITSGADPVIRAYGLWPHAGKEVTVFCCGVDMGEYTVSSTGYVDIPVDGVDSLLTTARVDLLAQRGADGTTWKGHKVWLDGGNIEAGKIPIVVGFNYTSQGQITRPVIPQETGSMIGPALAETRRSAQIGALLANTQGIYFGTDFSYLNEAVLTDATRTDPLVKTTLFSGVFWDTLDDDYSFDGQLCWEISRPYPATVLAVAGYPMTQER